MIVDTVAEFAEEVLRPAAHDADEATTYPKDLVTKAAELGVTAINVPEDFEGIASHRAAVTNALVAEALAYGDMGLALPILAPAGVASALTHWGSADQQATYLKEFAGENVPQACVAIAEPQPLFDPTALKTTAVRTPRRYRLDGVQAVAFMCANIAIEFDGLRLITWRGASRADQGLPFAREAALAKRLGADKGMQIGLDGVQLLGGHGYTKEHPVERWYRDLRAIGIAEGVVVI